MNKPKAIVFDYGDTLLKSEYFRPIDGTVELLKYANNPNNVTANRIQTYADEVLNAVGILDRHMLIQHHSKALMRLIYEVHGITFEKSYAELDAIFLEAAESTSLMEGIVELLEYLKSEGIRLAVLSNTSFCEESHRLQLRKHGIQEYFEFFIATSDYLVRKPDKRIFDVALTKLNLSSNHVWYIGNTFDFDVRGAYNANIFPVWINVENEKPHSSIDHLSVRNYRELYEILKNNWSE